MKRTWHVSRDVLPHPDAQRRWDRAYQLILHWAEAADHTGDLPPLGHQEERHADCHLRPCLDQTPAEPHD